jgi:hypothetical protein
VGGGESYMVQKFSTVEFMMSTRFHCITATIFFLILVLRPFYDMGKLIKF